MQSVLIVIHILIVVALIVVVLLQRSEGGALGTGGGTGSFMTGRGQANALSRATAILGALFFATALLMSILSSWSRAPHSILGKGPAAGRADARRRRFRRATFSISSRKWKAVRRAFSPRACSARRPGRSFRAGAESPDARLKSGRRRSATLPVFRDERRVRHNADQMFDLVADVERYPEFVPLCKALKVRSRRADPDGRETLVADMTVGYKLIRETFTSRVTLDRPQSQGARSNISTGRSAGSKTSGPSRTRLKARARASASSSTTNSRAGPSALLMGSMFDAAFRKFAGAFERRADAVYGRAVRVHSPYPALASERGIGLSGAPLIAPASGGSMVFRCLLRHFGQRIRIDDHHHRIALRILGPDQEGRGHDGDVGESGSW